MVDYCLYESWASMAANSILRGDYPAGSLVKLVSPDIRTVRMAVMPGSDGMAGFLITVLGEPELPPGTRRRRIRNQPCPPI